MDLSCSCGDPALDDVLALSGSPSAHAPALVSALASVSALVPDHTSAPNEASGPVGAPVAPASPTLLLLQGS